MRVPFTNIRLFERAREFRTGAQLIQPPMPRVTPEMAEITRQFQELNQRMFRAFDAAMSSPFNADFRGTYGSANTEILQGDYTVMARTRSIAKDTPHGKGTVRGFQNNVVGDDPFKLKMRYGKYVEAKPTPASGGAQSGVAAGALPPQSIPPKRKFVRDEKICSAIETEWDIFGRPENFTVKGDCSRMEALRIAEASLVRDGRLIIRHHDACPFTKHGYAIEMLEADRLQTQFQGRSDDGNPIRFSIEFDKVWNRPVAYWILEKHPLDATGQSMLANTQALAKQWNGRSFRVRIDAEDITLFNNLRDRAEQDIGFTELDACVQSLWRMFQYEKALTYAAIASCCKPFWIKKTLPTGMQANLTLDEMGEMLRQMAGNRVGGGVANTTENPGQGQQGIRNRSSTEIPGATLQFEYGEELMQTDPKFPIEAARYFRQDNARDGAIGVGLSYQAFSGDFQSLGFAASLMSQIPMQDNCKVRQQHTIDSELRPIFKRWLKAMILSTVFEDKYGFSLDILKLDEYVDAAIFQGKRWPFVNPLVEAQALIIQTEAGFLSPQQVQDRLPGGLDIDDLYAQIEEANESQASHNLDFHTVDVTRPTISKGEPEAVVPAPAEAAGQESATTTKPANPVRSSVVSGQSSVGRRARRAEVMRAAMEMSLNGH